MAGLSLIGTYSSDSDNDDGDSCDLRDSYEKTDEPTKSSPLPLPQSIIELKGVAHHEEVIDDPIDHDGRTRSFKHERGNWATLIYVEYKPEECVRTWMEGVTMELPVHQFDQYHLSLTRTLVLKFHWIESFVESVKSLCGETKRFAVELGTVEVYRNDERTRTFLAIGCTAIDDSLTRLVDALNKLLGEYQLPPFYEDSSFHISFTWCNGDVVDFLKSYVPALSTSLERLLLENSGSRITIDRLHCKIGNKMYVFQLK